MAKKTKKKAKQEKIDLSKVLSSEEVLNKKILSKEQQKAFDIIQNTKKNLFINGSAGSGKSTFITYLKNNCTKSIVVCSPTAMAAINIGGQTIHSFFKLPVCDFIGEKFIFKGDVKELKKILLKTQLLIIDEVSMVRPDILDAVDIACKKLRGDKKHPFGGIQVLLVGDIYQLPPVIKEESKKKFKEYYESEDAYFFDAFSYKEGKFSKMEFTHIYRQLNNELLNHLNDLRTNTHTKEAIDYFNKCIITNQDILNCATTITPYRKVADIINYNKLKELSGEVKKYHAVYDGSFIKSQNFPAQEVLELKLGALVMLIKNKRPEWHNGSTGIVTAMNDDFITVRLLDGNKTVFVEREDWEDKKYSTVFIKQTVFNEKTNKSEEKLVEKIVEEVIGKFTQFPIQLAWSCTIHKAQGKTLDKVIIDIGRGAFAHGQLYVALSRTRNFKDIHLKRPIHITDSIISDRVIKFMSGDDKNVKNNTDDNSHKDFIPW